jgi:hypothetical protein
MVSNHVDDLLRRHPKEDLPPALVEYVERKEGYDYSEHSRRGAAHGSFVDDDTCDRFGVSQYNIYLMTGDQESTLETYGREIIPAVNG